MTQAPPCSQRGRGTAIAPAWSGAVAHTDLVTVVAEQVCCPGCTQLGLQVGIHSDDSAGVLDGQ
jgi:hypothetical protein